jgi:hypothetical protein
MQAILLVKDTNLALMTVKTHFTNLNLGVLASVDSHEQSDLLWRCFQDLQDLKTWR